jgi:Ca2+-binding RTX toxin-like protein
MADIPPIAIISDLWENSLALIAEAPTLLLTRSGSIVGPYSYGVRGDVSNCAAFIGGSVVANHQGITLGSVATTGEKIVVYEGGSVSSIATGYGALAIMANSSSITNAGLVSGADYGIYFDTQTDDGGKSQVLNTGTVSSDKYGIYALGHQELDIRNTGTISGKTASFYEFQDEAVQKITNNGQMFGDVLLGGGDDTFNSRWGAIDGAIRGGDGNDRIVGSGDDDRIYGEEGADILTGGAGQDTFVFTSSAPSLVDIDKIKDFNHDDDVFELQFFSIFRHIGPLQKTEFRVIADPNSTTGVTAATRILYDKADGDIFFDRDGSGTKYDRVELAHVQPNTVIDYTDFQLGLNI